MEKYQNFRTEARVNLKQANIEFSNCFNEKFLPKWLNGASLQIGDVCGSELSALNEKDKELYGEFQLKQDV